MRDYGLWALKFTTLASAPEYTTRMVQLPVCPTPVVKEPFSDKEREYT